MDSWYGAGSRLQQDRANVPVSQRSGSSAVEQQACAPVAGILLVDRDLAVEHTPSMEAAAMGGADNASKRMRTVNCRIMSRYLHEIQYVRY